VNELISVVIPIYNAATTLGECLRSVLHQTYPHFEVIAIDDGSDDDSADMLAGFAAQDTRIKVLKQEHGGIVSALNNGLQQCRGHYVARMDADDRMLPERLAQQLRFACRHPHIDLIGARFRLFRTDAPLSPAQQRYRRWSNDLLDDRAIKRAMFLEAPLVHPTFFARRAFFQAMGGYHDRPWAEDYDFLLRARARGAGFAKVAQILLEKRDSPDRLYRTDPRCKRRAMLAAKAHFFTRGSWLDDGKSLYLAGTGPSGRTVAKALNKEGIAVTGFIDGVIGPPHRTVMGIPAWYRNSAAARALFAAPRHHFFISCIGDPQGRAEQESQWQATGLRYDDHYLRFL
jgi:glycosyltransferase involved in cell wall biosynthesis